MNSKKTSQQGLTADQQQLVSEHLDFAMNMGKKFRGRGVSVDDLQQEACLGLCEAAFRYDADRQNEFQTYAYSWCLKYIMKAINHYSDQSNADDDVERLGGDIVDDEVNHQDEYALRVRSLLGGLTKKEREVVCMVYGIVDDGDDTPTEPLDLKQIADKMNLRPLRVKQLYDSGMMKMKSI